MDRPFGTDALRTPLQFSATLSARGTACSEANAYADSSCDTQGPSCSERPTISGAKLAVNLITGGLGTGILSLPWSTAGATLIPALVIIFVVLAVNAWTIRILVGAAERFQTFDLGGLLSHLPGACRASAARALCNATVWASMFLSLAGYLVAIGDSASRVLGEGQADRRLLLCAAALLVLPLCFLSQERLAFTSSLSVAVYMYIFIFLGLLLGQEVAKDELEVPCIFNTGRGVIAMVSAMMQSVIIQMCVLPMYEELDSRTPEKFNRIIALAFAVLFFIYAGFAVLGQTLYGLDVESNILKNLPRSTGGFLAQSGTVVAIAGVYPIMLMPMVAPLRSSGFQSMVKPTTFAIVLASLCAAFMCDDLGYFNVLNGALCVGVFVGLVPALVGVFLLGLGRTGLVALAVAACVVSMLGFVYTQNFATDNAGAHCLWYGL